MLTVKDLHKSYQVGKTTYEVLKGVSLTVEKGEFVACLLYTSPAPNSALFDEGCDCSSGDYFHAAHPDTDWAVCLEHAEKIGIGTRAYELIKI